MRDLPDNADLLTRAADAAVNALPARHRERLRAMVRLRLQPPPPGPRRTF